MSTSRAKVKNFFDTRARVWDLTLPPNVPKCSSFLVAVLRALDHCKKRYKETGEPTGRWELINFLDRMIQELKRNGMGYPKALLLRKKELQRQQFTVCKQVQDESDECTCFDGWLLAGKPCSCPEGDPHREQLRKWGMNA